MKKTPPPGAPKQANLFAILTPYRWFLVGLLGFSLLSNGLSLLLPRLLARGIDQATSGVSVLSTFGLQFLLLAIAIFGLTYLQSVLQTLTSERVAKNLRNEVASRISMQDFAYVQKQTSSKLLTNLTSDMDAIKQFVSQAIVSLVSSVFLIVGASVLLLITNWKLALAVLAVLPVIGIVFYVVFSKMGVMFMRSRTVIDALNRTINESILGSSLVRVLNAQNLEHKKFLKVNGDSRDLGLEILAMFATVIPVISLVANLATLIILLLGGHFVITGTMSLGKLTAFNSYVTIMIFPIIMIGFMSSAIGRAQASYTRVKEVLDAEPVKDQGTIKTSLKGNIELKDVSVTLGERAILKDVSFAVQAKTKTAILGPTAAGKTQLLYLLTGLLKPTSGTVNYDGHSIEEYEKTSFYAQVGFVFQDSILFNMSVKENIAFRTGVKEEDLQRAIETAELQDFVAGLPEGLNTIVSERGTSLSGGQKQRIMLARALALNPKVLLLDDFTARVDANTEKRILANVEKNYPDLTLVSVTQKISSVEHYDKIILLMEGEVLAEGSHEKMMETSPEYVQIYESQKSTNRYDV